MGCHNYVMRVPRGWPNVLRNFRCCPCLSVKATINKAARMRQVTLQSGSHSLSTSQAAARQPACRCRRALAVSNTLVGPDPRLASSLSSSTASAGLLDFSKPAKALKGKDVEEAAMWRCIKLQQAYPKGLDVQLPPVWDADLLQQAYGRCAEVTSEYAKTFYLGTQLMTPAQAQAIWAIYVWCRRTDELVDGPNASRITPKVCPAVVACSISTSAQHCRKQQARYTGQLKRNRSQPRAHFATAAAACLPALQLLLGRRDSCSPAAATYCQQHTS